MRRVDGAGRLPRPLPAAVCFCRMELMPWGWMFNSNRMRGFPPTFMLLALLPAAILGREPAIDEKLPPPAGRTIDADKSDHWAYRPLVKPAPPSVGPHEAWVENPIDAFIAAQLV